MAAPSARKGIECVPLSEDLRLAARRRGRNRPKKTLKERLPLRHFRELFVAGKTHRASTHAPQGTWRICARSCRNWDARAGYAADLRDVLRGVILKWRTRCIRARCVVCC